MKQLLLLPVLACFAACNTTSSYSSIDEENATEPITGDVVVVPNLSHERLPQRLPVAVQHFEVSGKCKQVVIAQKGLKVWVDPAQLETVDGLPVQAPIEVSIKELHNVNDFIQENAATVCNGKLLQSGGSYWIAMEAKGKTLQIKKGSALQMELPIVKKGNMELFYGERNASGEMNWLPAKQSLKASVDTDKENIYPATQLIKKRTVKMLRNKGIEINASASYQASIKWLKAYEDSTIRDRRIWFAANQAALNQSDRYQYLHWPIKIGLRDEVRLRIPFTGMYGNREVRLHKTVLQNGALEVTHYLSKSQFFDSSIYTRDTVFHDIAGGKSWMKPATPEDNSLNGLNIVGDNGLYSDQQNAEFDVNNDMVALEGNLDQLKKDTLTETTADKAKLTLSYYEPVAVKSLGWINCDRFYNNPDGYVPVYTIQIEGKAPTTIGVYTIFRGVNGMMHAKLNRGDVSIKEIAGNLPNHQPVEFIFYGKVDGQLVECRRSVQVENNLTVPIAFQPVAKADVRKLYMN